MKKLLLFLIFLSQGFSYKILMCPHFSRNSFYQFTRVAQHLTQDGNQVTMLAFKGTSYLPQTIHSENFKFNYFPLNSDPNLEILRTQAYQSKQKAANFMVSSNQLVLNSITENWLTTLKNQNFDIGIIDNDIYGSILIENLNLKPIKIITSILEPYNSIYHGIPGPSSYIFSYPTSSFLQSIAKINPHPHSAISRILKIVNWIQTKIEFLTISNTYYIPQYLGTGEIHPQNYFLASIGVQGVVDPLLRPPNWKYIYPLYPRDDQPLSEEFQAFLAQFKSVILISYGADSDITEKEKKVILETVKKMHFIGFIWKTKHDEQIEKLGIKNLLVKKCLPRSQLLEQEKVKAIINNGDLIEVFDALHSGKPIIAKPIRMEEFFNCEYIQYRRYGFCLKEEEFFVDKLQLGITLFTGDTLASEIQKQKDNVMKQVIFSSRITKEKEKNGKSMAYWVRYVGKYGVKHLVPSYTDMSWWKFYNLDIYLVLLLCFWIFIKIMVCLCCCRPCRRSAVPKVKTSQQGNLGFK